MVFFVTVSASKLSTYAFFAKNPFSFFRKGVNWDMRCKSLSNQEKNNEYEESTAKANTSSAEQKSSAGANKTATSTSSSAKQKT